MRQLRLSRLGRLQQRWDHVFGQTPADHARFSGKRIGCPGQQWRFAFADVRHLGGKLEVPAARIRLRDQQAKASRVGGIDMVSRILAEASAQQHIRERTRGWVMRRVSAAA